AHQDQQTTDHDATLDQSIQVIAPHHPLYGQRLPLLRRLRKRGEPLVVVRLPSGATQQLPQRWTDLGVLPPHPRPETLPRFSLVSLRDLLHILQDVQARSCVKEDPYGPSRSPVGDVCPPEPT
ncbi:MAG: hypothetical protein H0X24_23530, partial [Ktedonobacterales bacterium]|nr:hypothetical protein [Ktedonobacterales bacterium]